MKKTILPGVLLASSFASFVACRGGDVGVGSEVGAEAAITDTEGDEEFYQRRIACIHHRRERTRAGAELERGFHLKTHGCLDGQMTVNPKLDPDLRVGVFAMHTTGKDKAYDHRVLARLTNINQLADSKLDLRGLGLKVVGVPGTKMWSGDPLSGQDFLMNDTRVHFLNAPRDVVRASEITDGAKVDPAKDGPIIQALQTRAQGQLSQPHTLLSNEYHSRAPFKLGSKYIIRYFVETCAKTEDRQFGDSTGDAPKTNDHLTSDLAARAQADEGICMLLRARLRPAAESASWLEDYITPWNETPVTLATIVFPKQDVAANEALCKDLELNPYHSIEAHQPVGAMNKGRYWIYKASRAAASLRGNIDRFDCNEIYPDFERRLSR